MEKFFEDINFQQEPLGIGKVLISEPFLTDQNFNRSVILMVQHDDQEGALGFVLNRPSEILITDIFEDFPTSHIPVFMGGPVGLDQMFYIHKFGEEVPNSTEVLPGIFWGGNFDALQAIVRNNPSREKDIRFFAGYSGWAPHQLEAEIKERSWIVSKLTNNQIMSNSPTFWEDALKTMGKKFKIMAQFPEDPSLN